MVAAIQSLLPLLLLFCGPTVASTSIWTREYGSYQSQLQKYKLADYVPTALPSSDRSSKSLNATGGSLSGTDVFVDMVFYTVISTDVTSGRMALKVWHNLRWTDERLAWDPADFGNITTTFYAAAGHNRLEDTQIWVPDITLYNSLTAMTESLDPQLATVSSSGQVFWSRPGSLEVLCKYSGLVAFPFDTLRCNFEIGGWAYGGFQQGVELYPRTATAGDPLQGPGFVVERNQPTAGQAYSEHFIEAASARVDTFTYDSYGSEPFPVVTYTVVLQRNTNIYYWVTVLLPAMSFVVASFAVFLLDPDVGERLGYGVTLILATAVYQLVLTEYVPVCGEILWVTLYLQVCTIFTFISTFESCLVLYLWKARGNDMERHLLHAISVIGDQTLATPGAWIHSEHDTTLSAAAAVLYERAPKRFIGHESRSGAAVGAPAAAIGTDVSRLLLLESLFFKLKPPHRSNLLVEELRMFLAYAAIEQPISQRAAAIERLAQPSSGHARGTVVEVDRLEFVRATSHLLSDTPEDILSRAVEAYTHTVEALASQAAQARMARARRVDEVACIVLPCTFITAMVIVFGLDFTDGYLVSQTDGPVPQMFTGFPNATWEAWSAALTFLIPLAAVVIYIGISRANLRRTVRKQQNRAHRLHRTWSESTHDIAERSTSLAEVAASNVSAPSSSLAAIFDSLPTPDL